MEEQFKQALEKFLVAANGKVAATYSKPIPLEVSVGKKYIRVIQPSVASRSVFCFIDKENGNILKANSWAVPHKTPRGNIFSEDSGVSAVNGYGANYIK